MTLELLLAEREIYRNLVRFARVMDERQWHWLDDITTDDIQSDVGVGARTGRDEFVGVMRQFLDQCGTTQHIIGNVLIDVDGDTATSTADVSDMHLGKGRKKHLTFRTLGRYTDKWIKVDGQWRMSERVKDNRGNIGTMRVFNINPKTLWKMYQEHRARKVEE